MKRRIGRIALAGFVVLLLAVMVGPFLVPVPPLTGTLPPPFLWKGRHNLIRAIEQSALL